MLCPSNNPDFTLSVCGGYNFVKPPSVEEMEKRLRLRQTDSEEKILERVAKAEKEISYAKDFDVILINDDLEVAKNDAFNLVNNFIQK